MTLVGYLILLISLLVFINILKNRKFISLKKISSKLDFVEFFLVFLLIFWLDFLYAKIIIGLVLLNAFVWIAFHRFMKSIKYTVLSWVIVFVFGLYLYATYSNFGRVSSGELWTLTLFVWSGAFLMILIYESVDYISRFVSSVIVSLVGLILLTPPFVFVLYNTAFNTQMNVSQLNAIYQSNLRESFEFIMTYASFSQLFLIPLFITGLVAVLFYQGYFSDSSLRSSVYSKIVVFLLVVVNLNFLQHLSLPSLIINTKEIYAQELAKFREELDKRKVGDVSFKATKEDEKELYIVIVGESLNKNHMSLYGYHRTTSPILDSIYQTGTLVKYENAFSNHTHTVPVLTQALTSANQLNKNKYYTSLSILDVMEQAGFDTYWLSNQVSFGEWDNPISVLAERADTRVNINTNIGMVTKTNLLDDQLVDELRKIVDAGIKKNTVVFLHMMGNHGAYKNRYPSNFNFYSGDLPKEFFGDTKYWAENVNEYDNSVRYQDQLIGNVIGIANQYKGTSACLYFSDHSEAVFANKGHNSSSFTFEMTETPLFAWFSEAYKTKYTAAYNNFNTHKENLFSNDFIYDVLVDFVGIRTDQYNSERSLMRSNYRLDDNECYTLHGKMRYTDSKNTLYHQQENLNRIHELHLNSKVYPHRVNTIGKLSDVLYSGCTSFEVDVIFKQDDVSPYFEIGHDNGSLSGIRLEDFLIKLKANTIDKIWLDIKNLEESNFTALKKRLVELDVMYDLHSNVIVESTSALTDFSDLRDLGFHTSFYIPTNIKNLDKSLLESKAKLIGEQVNFQKVSAVSFDASLYPFVKENLEQYLDPKTVYHTWDLSLKLKNTTFWDELSHKKFFKDERVKSILVKYQSLFEL